jgi:hypothetical protein
MIITGTTGDIQALAVTITGSAIIMDMADMAAAGALAQVMADMAAGTIHGEAPFTGIVFTTRMRLTTILTATTISG